MSESFAWLPALVGLAAAIFVAVKISRQGGLYVERLWIMPAVAAAALWSTASAVGADALHSYLVWICAAIGVVIGHIQARFAIDHVEVTRRVVVTRGGAAMLLVGLTLAGIVQWLLNGVGGFDTGAFAVACLAMGLAHVTTEKLTYFLAFWRARAAERSTVAEHI